MEYQAYNPQRRESILTVENDLERAILERSEVQDGLYWGYPRFGHPEGKVIFHVKEIFDNIDKLQVASEVRRKLRLIALTHDTFKYQEDASKRASTPTKHHAYIAYDFVKEYINDVDVLQVIKTHDDAYYAWRADYAYRDPEGAKVKLDRLLLDNAAHLDLYYTFFVCDTRTGDKNQSPIRWFEDKINPCHKIRI
jgi:hypothetical protein